MSKVGNIGNYTPVWGIEKMLLPYTVTSRVHCNDYKKVNINKYDVALIGGAGLFHDSFSDFWKWISTKNIPIIIWGVGICSLYNNTPFHRKKNKKKYYVSPNIINKVKKNIVLCNIRDEKTNSIYDLNGDVGFCPTAIYFKEENKNLKLGKNILFANHTGLTFNKEKKEIEKFCDTYTTNVSNNFKRIIKEYKNAKIIVTTRLHGAIIANSLNRNYIAYVKDLKVEEFHRLYGGGVITNKISEIPNLIKMLEKNPISININYDKIESFGKQVITFLDEKKK